MPRSRYGAGWGASSVQPFLFAFDIRELRKGLITSVKSVIMGGFRHTVESPRYHFPDAELWLQSTSARAWNWILYDWSRWFDIHEVEPSSYYPGIRIMRPDVLDWYHKQGSERPIYMTRKYPEIIGSQAFPVERLTEKYGADHLGCQLDYMAMMALDEGFDRWILYGIGQPYVDDREGPRAKRYLEHHGHFPFYWLRKALKAGVQIVMDTFESNLITPEMIRNEEKYPTPEPLKWRYGYDMNVGRERIRETQTEDYKF